MDFKCKMCGGELDIDEVNQVACCKYCGSKQSLVRLLNEKSFLIYDKANDYLRHNEYDKACSLFEELLIDHNKEADLYFQIVLCKYGVRYVDDPKTHQEIPTINRVQYTSIYDDENYKLAIKYANNKQKEIFESEAKRLNDIQKEILEISKKEANYDLFICYKETDEKGRRTEDSVIAQDIYKFLTKKGYKVFFARISLEDKLGVAYEPYIFSALQSARIMLVVGTNSTNLTSIWVENEWSRYLSLMKDDEARLLIPVIKDMSPYDLPSAFNKLEALDLSKNSSLDDLLTIVVKRLGLREEELDKVSTKKEEVFNVDLSLELDQAYELIKNRKFSEADKLLEAALNKNPMEEKIYLYKLFIECEVTSINELEYAKKDFSDSYNLKRIDKFNNEKLKEELNIKLEALKKHLKEEALKKDLKEKQAKDKREKTFSEAKCNLSLEERYKVADEILDQPFDASSYLRARNLLSYCGDYKGADKLLDYAEKCLLNHGYSINDDYYTTSPKKIASEGKDNTLLYLIIIIIGIVFLWPLLTVIWPFLLIAYLATFKKK